MTEVLDDQVRLMESSWFMSYPHDVYARLRREAPGLLVGSATGSGRSRSTTTCASSRRSRSSSPTATTSTSPRRRWRTTASPSRDGSTMPRAGRAPAHRGAWGPLDTDNLVMADGARHRFLRKIASYAFTPKAINELEQQVQQIASELFDEIPEDVEVDFVDTVAAPLPMIMIALMLGVPIEELDELPRVVRLVHRVVRRVDARRPRLRRTASTTSSSSVTTSPSSCRTVSRTRATTCSPTLVQAEWEGEPLELEDQLSMAQVLLIAGNETTRGLIAGAGQAMAEHPDQRRILVDAPELIAPARSRSSCATSRRSRTCAGPRSTTSRSAGSRSAGATSSACSTRRPTATRTSGSAPTSST